MSTKRCAPEQIINKLRQAEVEIANGAEFTAQKVREWLSQLNVKTLYIEPGSPWENGCIESFNGKLRDELLDGEIFYTLREAQVLIERWRRHHNTVRPHSSLGYRPPAPAARQLWAPGLAPLGHPLQTGRGQRIRDMRKRHQCVVCWSGGTV